MDTDMHLFFSLIAFTDKEPKDFMVPSRWGTVSVLAFKYFSVLALRFTDGMDRSTDARILMRRSRATNAARSCDEIITSTKERHRHRIRQKFLHTVFP